MVRDYTAFMGAVDMGDQMYQYYSFGRKTRKWTKKLFWYLLEIMKLNSHVMFNSMQENNVNLHDYTIRLSTQLIAQATVTITLPPVLPAPAPPKEARLVRRCFIKRMATKILCRVCRDRVSARTLDRPHTSQYGCPGCGVNLCIDPCFEVYHTVAVYAKWRGEGPVRPPTVAVDNYEVVPYNEVVPNEEAEVPVVEAAAQPVAPPEAAAQPVAPPEVAAVEPDMVLPDILPPKRRRQSRKT